MTRVHTQVRPLHPQSQAGAEAVSESSSISGGMAVCGRASPYFRRAVCFVLIRETDLRGTACISFSPSAPPALEAMGETDRTGAAASWSFN